MKKCPNRQTIRTFFVLFQFFPFFSSKLSRNSFFFVSLKETPFLPFYFFPFYNVNSLRRRLATHRLPLQVVPTVVSRRNGVFR